MVIAFIALYLAHGVNIGTTVALAGTLAAWPSPARLAFGVAAATNLTGLADGRAQTLRVTAEALDLRGLLVAGIVVGALGVLDDVTVSQVSIVAALRRANPGLSRRLLYREATKVGRDHVASTVNTLVLAYAGASLPLLLFFAQGDQPVGPAGDQRADRRRDRAHAGGLDRPGGVGADHHGAGRGGARPRRRRARPRPRRRRRRRRAGGAAGSTARHRGRRDPPTTTRPPATRRRRAPGPPAGTRRVGGPVAGGRLSPADRAVSTSSRSPGSDAGGAPSPAAG